MSSPTSPSRWWSLYAMGWIPFLGIYISAFALSGELSLWHAVAAGFNNVLPFAVYGLGVVWLCSRLPWHPNQLRRLIGLHAVAGISYAALSAFSALGLVLLMRRVFSTSPEHAECVACIIVWQFFMGLMIYTILSSLTYAYRTTARLREEERRASRAEALKAQAELQALRAQLNPHFLFNTLHTLIALVRRDPAAAEDGIEQFADLLRYASRVHQETRDEVTLAEEWEFVQCYLALETLRVGDRLRLHTTLQDQALECTVPSFCLQPLVENAVRHGIAPRAGGGTIWIGAGLSNGELRLEVRDDGPGTTLASVDQNARLGLRLVRQRLEALYGPRARFEVVTAPNAGFTVRLFVPTERRTPAVDASDGAGADR